jgi:tetratricopeptide (TPR) repeat protein
VQVIPSIMIGGRRHVTLVNRGASREREREIDMTRQWFFVIALVAGAIVFVGFTLLQWLSPTQRALKWAQRGDSARAIDRLNALIASRPSAPALHGTLGQVYLMAQRPHEAETVLRKALALGSRNPSHHGALGWALVQLGRLDEALPVAEEANRRAHEDFEVYCLYCGLMAHHGRGNEVVQLFDFLKRSSIQLQKLNPQVYQKGLGAKFEFARSMMNGAGFA